MELEHQAGVPEQYNQNNLLSAGNRTRIIGDPGSGKSSLIKRVFRDACLLAIAKPTKAKLAILVALKSLSIPKASKEEKLGEWFYGFLKQTVKKSDVYGMEECFENYAHSSGLLVLLDGLDEVASSTYERVHAATLELSCTESTGNLALTSVASLKEYFARYEECG
jgi:predicted NACHT family NTPase